MAETLHRLFPAHSLANGGLPFLIIAAVLSALVFFLLTILKPRGRKSLIVVVTFLCGLFYTLEFFWPVKIVDGQEKNPLTDYTNVVSDINQIITAVALGVGIYSLSMLHGKNILRARPGWFFSLTFFVGMIVMTVLGLLTKWPGHEKIAANTALNEIFFRGGLQALDATMFSIIAFYIVSAAYRAFRIRSTEATLMMAAAFFVMLGQVYAGQFLTSWLPTEGFLSNLRAETLSDWLLTRLNAPAVRAIGFGLGVGLLATALRIWLSLERGSYFEREL